MPFGYAIASLKAGQRVSRQGWNGDDMFVFLTPGTCDQLHHSGPIDAIPLSLFRKREGEGATQLPSLSMKTASGSIVTGWLASLTDMLAEDWFVVPDEPTQ